MTTSQGAFIVFGLGSQALLVAFFAARRWQPDRRACSIRRLCPTLGTGGMSEVGQTVEMG